MSRSADGAGAVWLYQQQQPDWVLPDWVLPDWVLPDWVLPDWVLMDIRMHPTDGFEAARRIIAQYPHAQIVIVTQYDDQELREDA